MSSINRTLLLAKLGATRSRTEYREIFHKLYPEVTDEQIDECSASGALFRCWRYESERANGNVGANRNNEEQNRIQGDNAQAVPGDNGRADRRIHEGEKLTRGIRDYQVRTEIGV